VTGEIGQVRSCLRIVAFVLALAVMLGIVAGGVWFVYTTLRAPAGSASGPSLDRLESLFLGIYLEMRRGDVESPAGTDPQQVPFTVYPAETPADIGRHLQAQGLIRDAELFRLLVKQRGVGERLEAGEYELQATMTMDEIINKLQRGRLRTTTITIPEGWRLEQVAEYLGQQNIGNPQDFLRLARSNQFDSGFAWLRERPAGSTLEGYLFPDTYQIDATATISDVILLLLQNFDRRVTPQMRQQAAATKYSLYEVLTIASLVEREAVKAEERPLIASVYLNRLDKDMALEADSTVQYALGYQPEKNTWWRRLSVDQLRQVESPYNTYLHRGLPPGPICSPGLASIQAVLQPAQTDYLYYYAKGDGSHAFARTFEEHLENQQKYRQ
jgi:UPF0755 protein